MSYVVIRSCAAQVDTRAFGRWYRKGFGGTADDVARIIERLRKGRRHTFFLDERGVPSRVSKAVSVAAGQRGTASTIERQLGDASSGWVVDDRWRVGNHRWYRDGLNLRDGFRLRSGRVSGWGRVRQRHGGGQHTHDWATNVDLGAARV